jgi:hypothetical protein
VGRVIGLALLVGIAIVFVSLYRLLPHPENVPAPAALKSSLGSNGAPKFVGPVPRVKVQNLALLSTLKPVEVVSNPEPVVPLGQADAAKILKSVELAERAPSKPMSPTMSFPSRVEAERYPLEDAIAIGEPSMAAGAPSLTAPNASSSQWRLNDQVPEITMSKRWLTEFYAPSQCSENSRRTVYFFHHRKAAGTTLRMYFRIVHKAKYLESEGVSLPRSFKRQAGIVTVTSLRDPIDRIVSLYWYEHVAWWLDVKKNVSMCLDLPTWLASWSDESPWKISLTKNFPGNSYVEVSNYYVKSLSGWTGEAAVTELDLEVAKQKLDEFDIVLITDWLYNTSTQDLLK